MFSASAYYPQPTQRATPTILVIEDDTNNRQLTNMMLRSAKYNCLSEKSIEQGRQILQNDPIHLVVCDLHFNNSPVETLALLADMRADLLLARIPVIIMTGDRSEKAKRLVMSAGAAGIIIKPFETEELLTLVKQCLSDKRA